MRSFSFRLTHKIMTIGFVGLLGLASFGGIYQYGSWSQERSRTSLNAALAVSDRNHQLAQEMLEGRRAEKDFQLRRDQAYSKRHAELSASITAHLEQLSASARAAGLAQAAEKVVQVRTGFERYGKEFAAAELGEVKLGLNENLGLSGSLRTAVHDIEAKLKEVDDPRLTSWMLMMRRHEKDFMLRRDAKYVGELKKAAAEFSRLLAASELGASVKNDLGKKLDKYQADFVAWADGAQDVAAHAAAMTKEFHVLEPLIAEIEKEVERSYREASTAEAATRDSIRFWMWVAFAASILVVGAASFLIGRSISRALLGMIQAMGALARGDLSTAIPGIGRRDEIGEMAAAVDVFKTNMTETERLRAEQAAVEERQRHQRKAEMQRMANAFEGAVGEIVDTVSSAATELEASADTLTKAAARASELSATVAAGSEEASTNVQSVSAASEELSSSINEISRQVQESARVADTAVEQAQRTNARVGELSTAASSIGDVVQLINTIAEQTNLLALNATIEAARAGEAGRGFAVVAAEVKALAEQTARATGEITQHVSGIQAATQESVAAIEEIGGTIRRMSEIASAIASAVEEQGAATQEISRNIQQAASGTSQVSANVADVQRGAGETGAASSQVHSAAKSLALESNRLKLEVDRFLDSVRAA